MDSNDKHGADPYESKEFFYAGIEICLFNFGWSLHIFIHFANLLFG